MLQGQKISTPSKNNATNATGATTAGANGSTPAAPGGEKHLQMKIEELVEVKNTTKEKEQPPLLPPSCFGEIKLCKDDGCSDLTNQAPKILYVKSKFGNIFTNIIAKPGDTLFTLPNQKLFRSKDHYQNDKVIIESLSCLGKGDKRD